MTVNRIPHHNITARRRPMLASSHRAHRSFTLIELMIVIAVILILVAITVTVTVGILERSEARNTENTLRALDNILGEFELMRGRQVTFGISGSEPTPDHVYDIEQVRPAGFSWPNTQAGENQAVEDSLIFTDLLFARIARIEELRSMIATLPPDAVRELDADDDNLDLDLSHLENGFRVTYRFLDAWDVPIIAVHPGRSLNPQVEGGDYAVFSPTGDPDGSIRTPYENRFGVAANRNIFFVSAGPSNRFGDLQLDTRRDAIDDEDDLRDLRRADDNIYSYDVLLDSARPEN